MIGSVCTQLNEYGSALYGAKHRYSRPHIKAACTRFHGALCHFNALIFRLNGAEDLSFSISLAQCRGLQRGRRAQICSGSCLRFIGALLLSSQHCPGRNGIRTPAAFSSLRSAVYRQAIGRVPCGLRRQTNDLMQDRGFPVAEAKSLTHGETNGNLNSNLMMICQIARKFKGINSPNAVT